MKDLTKNLSQEETPKGEIYKTNLCEKFYQSIINYLIKNPPKKRKYIFYE